MSIFRKVIILVATLAGLLVIAGCQQDIYAKRGISRLPQNRPSSWENASSTDITR